MTNEDEIRGLYQRFKPFAAQRYPVYEIKAFRTAGATFSVDYYRSGYPYSGIRVPSNITQGPYLEILTTMHDPEDLRSWGRAFGIRIPEIVSGELQHSDLAFYLAENGQGCKSLYVLDIKLPALKTPLLNALDPGDLEVLHHILSQLE